MSLLDRLRRRPDDGSLSSSAEVDVAPVEGERGATAAQRPPSLQSRLSNLLALALLGTIGIGLLGWYYTNIMQSRASTRSAAQSSAKNKAEGEIIVRPLGRVDPPSTVQSLLGEAPVEPPPMGSSPTRLPSATESAAFADVPSTGSTPSPRDVQRERQLAGRAFAAETTRNAQATTVEDEDSGGASARGDLDALLRASVTPTVSAQVLPTRRLLLPKGAFLDCTLETALDSTLPGMTTCILATDTFSVDGSVVLLERGTKLVGETRGQVRQGTARVFVLWTEARTPRGVVVSLASSGTDELGRAGLPGKVNRHFFERFGAAILVSVIDGAVQAAAESQREDGGTVVVSPSASSQVLTEVLKSTIGIAPTVVKPQGDRIQILVARDLDFRSVYELRPVSR